MPGRRGDNDGRADRVAVDGRLVGAAIRRQVHPVLKAAGFGEFTDRKAWRQSEYTIDHVAFGSFSSYIAGGVGCTTFSLSVEAGVLFRCLAPELRRPQAQHLTFRSVLGKNLRQPVFHPYGREEATDRPDVWFVAPDGQNLDGVVDDAVVSLRQQGLPFMERYADPLRAFDSLLSERGKEADFGGAQVMMPEIQAHPDGTRRPWQSVIWSSLILAREWMRRPR